MNTVFRNSIKRAIGAVWLLILVPLLPLFAQEPKKSNPNESKAGIYGRVYTVDESTKGLKPITGAQIEIFNQANSVVGQATTNDLGYYSIKVAAGSYTFKVSAAGYRDEYSGRGFSLQITEGDAVQNFTLEKGKNDPNVKPPETPITTVGQLRGQIYEKTKKGEIISVQGAKVVMRKLNSPATVKPLTIQAQNPSESVPNSGYYTTLEAGKWQLSVQAEGFLPIVHPDPVEVLADKMAIQDLLLTRPPEPEPKFQGLQGQVVLLNAPKVAPPIRVKIDRLGGRVGMPPTTIPAPLNAMNQFKVDVSPGRFVVTAEADGYLPGRSEISDVLEGKYTTVEIQLKPRPAELLVKVFAEETKKPLAGATVKIRLGEEALSKAPTLRTAENGTTKYETTDLTPRQVLAMMPGYKSAGKPITLKAGTDNVVEIFLAADVQPSVLIVKVIDAVTLEVLPNVAIKVTPAMEKPMEGLTNPQGTLTLNMPKQGKFPIAATKANYTQINSQVEIFAGNNERTITMRKIVPEDATLTVRVFCAKVGEPLKDVTLRLTPLDAKAGLPLKPLTTNAQGISLVKLADLGKYTLNATVEGYLPGKQDIVVKAGANTQRIDLTPVAVPVPPMPKSSRLLVDVVQAGTQTPIAGARVLVGPIRTEAASRFDGFTDARGKVSTTALNPQSYSLIVDKEGFEKSMTQVTLSAGDTTKQIALVKKKEMPVPPIPPVIETAKLSLQVLSADKMQPISGAIVRITQGAKVIVTGNSDVTGNYLATLPSLGKYTVSVAKTGYELNQAPLDVTTKEMSRKVFLKPIMLAKRTINVLVREGGLTVTKPIEGVTVKIYNAKNEVVRTGNTNALGRFKADDLEVGIYSIEATAVGFVQRPARVASDITKGDDQPEVSMFRSGEQPIQKKKDMKKDGPVAKMVTMPDLKGKTLTDARRILGMIGLVPEFKEKTSMKLAAPTDQGVVVDQIQKANELVPAGSTVNLKFEYFR